MPRLLERRMRPGSDPGEPVMVQVWRRCECHYCEMRNHWFNLMEMDREKAEALVNSHNGILTGEA